MLELLARRGKPEAMAGSVDVVNAMVAPHERLGGRGVRLELGHRGARPDRSAGAGVPGPGARHRPAAPAARRSRKSEVAASELGQEAAFQDLWQKVEAMLTSYSDEKFVSDAYARELSGARARAMDVEASSDDPPERVAGWLATVADASLRNLDRLLLADLLRIEEDGARWRDIAETVITHAEDLVRVGYFDQALQLAESVTTEGARIEARQEPARAVLERLGRGAMMRHAAKQLRTADDASYERLKRLAHGIGPAVIAPLAEALSAEQDARSRRRLQRNPRRVRRGRARVGAAADERRQLGGPPHGRLPAARVRRRRGAEGAAAAAGRRRAARPAGSDPGAGAERDRRGLADPARRR